MERGVPVWWGWGVGQGPAQAQDVRARQPRNGKREHDEGRARGGAGGRILVGPNTEGACCGGFNGFLVAGFRFWLASVRGEMWMEGVWKACAV